MNMSKPEYDSAAVRLDSPSHGESPSRAAKPGVGTRIKAFLRRWWWLLLIIFVCLVLIIVLPMSAWPCLYAVAVSSSGASCRMQT